MPLWSDNFNRADGPIGTDWAVDVGTASISGNLCATTGTTYARAGQITGPGSAMAQATCNVPQHSNRGPSPAIKMDLAGSNCYAAHAYHVAPNVTYSIIKVISGVPNGLANYVWTGTPGSTQVLRLTYNGGTLTLYVDGVQMVQTSDTSYAANEGVGIFSYVNASTYDDFSCSGDGAPQLFVTPSVVGTEDGDVPISLLATAVTWTPGTPGTPSFTCDEGALSAQTINTTTTAQAVFSPPLTPQVVTITDPDNAISDTITVVEGTYYGGGGGGASGLSEAAVAWLEAQAAHGGLVLADNDESGGEVEGVLLKNAFGEILIGKRLAVGSDPYPSYVAEVLADLYARLWGGEEWQGVSFAEQGTNSLKEDLLDLRARWATGNPPNEYTAKELADLLSGTPWASHQDILTAIAAIPGGDNQEVLDAIAAAQGDPLATIKAVLDLVFLLDPTGTHDLGEILTAIAAVRGTGAPDIKAVMDKLALVQPTGTNTLDTLTTTVDGTSVEVLANGVAIGGVVTTVATIVDIVTDVLEIVTDLQNAIPPGAPALWPGLAGVTLGDPVALSDGLVVDGPMHGLLFTITGNPSGAGKYRFGDVDSWQHAGGVIFCTDNGDYERAESYGLERQIVVPRTMESADSAVIRMNNGWSGTVRTWVRSA